MAEDLHKKILELISLYESAKSELYSLREENLSLKDANTKYQKQINELNAQIEDLRISNAFIVHSKGIDPKDTISKLIRELDNCIKLLETD